MLVAETLCFCRHVWRFGVDSPRKKKEKKVTAFRALSPGLPWELAMLHTFAERRFLRFVCSLQHRFYWRTWKAQRIHGGVDSPQGVWIFQEKSTLLLEVFQCKARWKQKPAGRHWNWSQDVCDQQIENNFRFVWQTPLAKPWNTSLLIKTLQQLCNDFKKPPLSLS